MKEKIQEEVQRHLTKATAQLQAENERLQRELEELKAKK